MRNVGSLLSAIADFPAKQLSSSQHWLFPGLDKKKEAQVVAYFRDKPRIISLAPARAHIRHVLASALIVSNCSTANDVDRLRLS